MILIDLSRDIEHKMAVLPNHPQVIVSPFATHEEVRVADGYGFSSATLALVLGDHAGTHVDAPRHFFDAGLGVDALPLELLCGRTRVIEVTSRKAIDADDLGASDLSEDVRLLIKTHNSRLWGSNEFHTDYVGVSESAAKHLVERGVKVVGVDYLSVEPFKTPGAPTHHTLLGAGTIVIEGLNLRDVDPGVYEMYCLPLRLVGSDGAPARVVLRRS